MEQHDRTFLEITHVLLWGTLVGLGVLLAARLGSALGAGATDRALAAVAAAGVAALAAAPASRMLYGLNGFKVDAGHSLRMRRPTALVGALVLLGGLVLAGLAAR